MARTGRPPLPIEVKKARGTFRPDRQRTLAPVPSPDVLLRVEQDRYACPECHAFWVFEVVEDRTWRMVHPDGSALCEGN